MFAQGRGVPARFSGGDGHCNRICRGRSVCRPEPGPSQESFTGREPSGTTEIGAGKAPFPTGRDGARPLRENRSRLVHSGVRSPRPTEATWGAGRQRGGKGNTQIWGEKFHFGLANLYLVVYTESETKDIVAREQGAALRAKGTIPPESCGFPAFFRGSPRSGHVFSRESGKERG